MIIGVDRLDYSKGLAERFNGYRRFLEENPDWLGRVSFLQIAPPTRGEVHTYEHIRDELDALSGRINGAVRPCRLGADPLREPGLSARRPVRLLPGRRRRPGHAAARRHEPRRQGICRLAGSGRSGRADPLPLRRRGASAAARRCWSIPTARTRFRTRSARRWTCRGRSASGAGRRWSTMSGARTWFTGAGPSSRRWPLDRRSGCARSDPGTVGFRACVCRKAGDPPQRQGGR